MVNVQTVQINDQIPMFKMSIILEYSEQPAHLAEQVIKPRDKPQGDTSAVRQLKPRSRDLKSCH